MVALWHQQQQHHHRGLSVAPRGGLNLASPGPALCTQQYGSCVRDGPKWGRAEGSPASSSPLGHSVKIHRQILRVRLSTSTAARAGDAAGRLCWLSDLPYRTCNTGGATISGVAGVETALILLCRPFVLTRTSRVVPVANLLRVFATVVPAKIFSLLRKCSIDD